MSTNYYVIFTSILLQPFRSKDNQQPDDYKANGGTEHDTLLGCDMEIL